MKTQVKSMLAPVVIIALLSFTAVSCSNKDKCKTVVCANNGVCNGGTCTCPTGYEGSNCETVSREKFTGNWTVFEKGSTSNAAQYPVSVTSSDNNITDVAISHFNDYFTVPIRGVVSGETIYIPNQEYQGKIIVGQGTISYNVTYSQYGAISLKYEVIDSVTNAVDDYGYNANDLSNPSVWNK